MNQFDLLISTVPKAYPMQPFVNVLKQDATLVKVGAMEELQGVTGINVSPPGHGKDRAKQRCACRYVSIPQHAKVRANAMKHSLIIIFALLSSFSGFAVPDNANPASNQMRMKIGASTFTATLYDNATATAFKGMLPLTIKMSELNGNEKYCDLSGNLPTNASNPGKIQSGDLMSYGANTLVLFYKTLSTSYSYTRLGRINDTTGLAAAVGSGSVTVTYELE